MVSQHDQYRSATVYSSCAAAYLFGNLGGIGVIWYAVWISKLLAVLFAVFYTRKEFEEKVSLLGEKGAKIS